MLRLSGNVILGLVLRTHAHTDSKINFVDLGGLPLDLKRHRFLLDRSNMGYFAAEFLTQRRCIVREDLCVVRTTRD